VLMSIWCCRAAATARGMQQFHAAASAAAAGRSAFTAPSCAPRAGALHVRSEAALSAAGAERALPLMDGMPSRTEALAAQRCNLDAFLQAHQREFDVMEYAPWTRVPFKVKEVKTVIAASRLPGCSGLQGVFIDQDVPASYKPQQLVYYPGLLVTEELFVKFQSKYHCPTALELPALSGTDKMLVLGDPTAPGAIINDGVRSGRVGMFSAQAAARQQRILHAAEQVADLPVFYVQPTALCALFLLPICRPS
jgi:hypothetical protein